MKPDSVSLLVLSLFISAFSAGYLSALTIFRPNLETGMAFGFAVSFAFASYLGTLWLLYPFVMKGGKEN